MEKEHVTPDYLLSHGFYQYSTKEEGDIFEIPFGEADTVYFREEVFDRNIFVVSFSKNLTEEGHYHHTVYVQEDAGCGFVVIPERWWELPIEHFEAIYFGIRGENQVQITSKVNK